MFFKRKQKSFAVARKETYNEEELMFHFRRFH